MDPLMFLLKLAWESRYRLPLLITVGFMILDIRMQLEINIQTRTVRRHNHYEPSEADQEEAPEMEMGSNWASAESGGTEEVDQDDDEEEEEEEEEEEGEEEDMRSDCSIKGDSEDDTWSD